VSQDVITHLLREAGISFVGTVERIGAATMSDIPVSDHTAVVRVDKILDAPPSLSHLATQDITVLLSAEAPPVSAGQQFAFFTNTAVLGKSLAVTEVGRLPAPPVESLVAQTTTDAVQPLAQTRRQMEADDLRAHAGAAEAIVVGKVIRLEQAAEERYSEHAAHYWRATLLVQHVERGNVPGQQVSFLYPASQDVRWVGTPKPQPRQQGMWILHATSGAASNLAPFELLHGDDYRPAQHLESVRQPEHSA
jgi:hypothetical protein